MSGQPPGIVSTAPRPTTNGISSGGVGGIQQRANDSQVGSGSTGNGQSGNMSQSNLNSIVRILDFILLCRSFDLRFPILKNHTCTEEVACYE